MSKDKNSSYYDAGGIETLDIIKAKLTRDQYIGYLLGNCIKYTCRINFKDNANRDAEKAGNYAVWLVEAMEELKDEIDVEKICRDVRYHPNAVR